MSMPSPAKDPQTFHLIREIFTPVMVGQAWAIGLVPIFDLSRKRVNSCAGLAWRQIKIGVAILYRTINPTTFRLGQNKRTRTKVGLDMAIGLALEAVPAFANSDLLQRLARLCAALDLNQMPSGER